MFRFIHTSDWHLGQNFYGYDRSAEQRDFLRQLADIVHEQEPDALLVSGDIFHTAAPSSAAVSLYVNAMIDIHEACPGMSIIVIAGNHDSAARLESDSRLWKYARVNVLGGIARDADGHADVGRHLIKVGDKGIVAAVPFAYPASFPPVKGHDTHRDQRMPEFFQALLDQAQAINHDNLPVVLMAHLAVSHSDITGHDPNLMMEYVEIGTLGEGYDYAALGHIHRPQRLDEHTFYCGTPVPVSFDEQCEHAVSIVEIDAHEALPRLETKAIKNLKPLHTLPASEPIEFDQALTLLENQPQGENAYIRLNVLADKGLPLDANERAAQLASQQSCYFCEIKKTRLDIATRQTRQMTVEELSKASPLEVANRHYTEVLHREMTAEEKEMFNEIYRLVMEDKSK